jgi:hypothetical protein
MVYVVQSYLACFGLYPSSGMWKTKDHNVSETDPVSETLCSFVFHIPDDGYSPK